MAEIIKMPLMSDTMTEGVIAEWHKEVGDKVESGDLLAEIETDKATMEFEAPEDGILLYRAKDGDAVPVNALLAIIGEKDEKIDIEAVLTEVNGALEQKPEDKEDTNSAAIVAQEPQNTAPIPQVSEAVNLSSQNGNTSRIAVIESDGRLKASPLAKRLARENNIEISRISGSGEEGRIVKKDVLAYLENKPADIVSAPVETVSKSDTPAAVIAPFIGGATEQWQDIPASQMRKVIARRLAESKFGAPHFYLTMEVDMGVAIESRKRMNEYAPIKISFNDIIVKATAMALRQHPYVNGSWLGDKIRLNQHVNIGVAVAVEEGLLVPVLRFADQKSLSQLSSETRALAGKAKSKKLQPQEMQGNTFTISNLGMFGIDEFTAIINPPDACILAVGKISQVPAVLDGEIVIANKMKLTLSCDHRVVDGAKGAQFLQTLKAFLEDPVRLLI